MCPAAEEEEEEEKFRAWSTNSAPFEKEGKGGVGGTVVGCGGKMPKMTRAYHLPLFPSFFKAPGKDARNFLSRRLCFFSFGGGAKETFLFWRVPVSENRPVDSRGKKTISHVEGTGNLNMCNVDNGMYHIGPQVAHWRNLVVVSKKKLFIFKEIPAATQVDSRTGALVKALLAAAAAFA